MILHLAELPATLRGPDDDVYHGRLPRRARYLAPDGARSLLNLDRDLGGLVYTDVFRSAEASVLARRERRGTKRPGYSAHGFGLAFDLDVTATLRRTRLKYVELVQQLSVYGWFCHRRDLDDAALEAWHFNYLGELDAARLLPLALLSDARTWSAPIEQRIVERYGESFTLTSLELQEMLEQLGLYHGEIDGLVGPLTREAVAAFQRTWDLSEVGAGPATQRTLALVAADLVIESIATSTPRPAMATR